MFKSKATFYVYYMVLIVLLILVTIVGLDHPVNKAT